MKLKISTTITVDDNISDENIEKIRGEFEDVAWDNNEPMTQPSVYIDKE